MTMRSDHKALLFLGGIALLGAAVRVARAVAAPRPGPQTELEHQMQAADSARRAVVAKRAGGGAPGQAPSRSARGSIRGPARGPSGSPRDAARRPGQGEPAAASTQRTSSPGPGSPRDYRGRLDVDLASAAALDSLPGIGPTLAKRIAADRMANGPFRELMALRRVRGVSTSLLGRLDTLVGFSGAYRPSAPDDTILPERPPKKRAPRTPR